MLIRPAQPIATANKSQTDRRAVFVALDNESGIVDLLISQRNERFGQLRCIYIDTSTQDSDGNGCTIETDLGQNVCAPAGTQGYYPVFIPFVSKLNVTSNQAVNLLLLDFDVQPSQWQVSNAPDPQHVIIDGQPISTNATVENFPEAFGATQSGAWEVGVNNFSLINTIANFGIGGFGGPTVIIPAGQTITIKNLEFFSNYVSGTGIHISLNDATSGALIFGRTFIQNATNLTTPLFNIANLNIQANGVTYTSTGDAFTSGAIFGSIGY